jgi:hypothetical protein
MGRDEIEIIWFGRLACIALVISMSLGLGAAHAGPCIVSVRPYRLMADTVGWSMGVASGQNCIGDFRFNKVAVKNVMVTSPPESGQVTLQGSGFPYTSKSDFQGEDSFAVVVSGVFNGIPVRSPEPKAPTNGVADNTSPRTGVPLSSTGTHSAVGGWKTLKIGAGGLITGINIASDGTKVVRTDTYGAYVWDVGASTWKQVLTTHSMPASDVNLGSANGIYEIAIAPSLTSRLYMLFNGYVYRSENRGSNWSRTGFARVTGINPNGPTRAFGHYMAVDPANPDVVYVGTPSNGFWTTSNGGTSWSRVMSVGTATAPSEQRDGGGHLIAFDPASSVSGGVTQAIYVSTYGTGVYRSTNGGGSWTLTIGTPTTHRHLIVDQNGVGWMTDNSGNVYKGSNGSWSIVAGAGNSGQTVAVDPANANHVFVVNGDGTVIFSTNGGSKWVGPISTNRTASDVPWLAWTNESFMTTADAVFDPSGSNLLYLAEGIGVWWTRPPTSNTTVKYTSQSAGIEQLVGNVVLAPPGGKPVVLAWDRPVFYVSDPTVYPSTHGPNNAKAIIMGWSADWASTSPATIVAIMNWFGADMSGISTDGGQTWKRFAALPGEVPGKIGGCIAAASSTNFVWVTSNHGNPWRTIDGGSNWTQISISGVPSTGETGWGFAHYLDRQIVAADRVDADTFYMYNYGPAGSPSAAGLYRSTDKGATWTHVFSRSIASSAGYNAKLQSVPGHAGHLFFTSGPQSGVHPANTQFMRSIDGGKTWAAVGNFKEVHAFGFGAAYNGQNYPAIFVAGYNNGVWGIWLSIDNALTWTMIGDFPLGSFDSIKSIDGDKASVGTVYIAFGGSGFAYRTN